MSTEPVLLSILDVVPGARCPVCSGAMIVDGSPLEYPVKDGTPWAFHALCYGVNGDPGCVGTRDLESNVTIMRTDEEPYRV